MDLEEGVVSTTEAAAFEDGAVLVAAVEVLGGIAGALVAIVVDSETEVDLVVTEDIAIVVVVVVVSVVEAIAAAVVSAVGLEVGKVVIVVVVVSEEEGEEVSGDEMTLEGEALGQC